MAHFEFTRAGGIWADGSDFLHAEAADLDAKTQKAINGDDGGTWSPSDAIVIGGAGLVLDGPFVSNGGFEVNTNAEINGDIVCTGNLNLLGTDNWVNGELTITDGALFVEGATSTESLAVSGASEFSGEVTLAGPVEVTAANPSGGRALTVTNGVHIGGAMDVLGIASFGENVVVGSGKTLTCTGPIDFIQNGRATSRSTSIATDENFSVDPAQTQWVMWPFGVGLANRVATLQDGINGDWVGFTNENIAHTLILHNSGGDTMQGIGPSRWLIMRRIGGAWRKVAAGELNPA